MEKTKTKAKPIKASCKNKCPDYDKDCTIEKIGDPVACFIGGLRVGRTGIISYLERAKGYCPLIYNSN